MQDITINIIDIIINRINIRYYNKVTKTNIMPHFSNTMNTSSEEWSNPNKSLNYLKNADTV